MAPDRDGKELPSQDLAFRTGNADGRKEDNSILGADCSCIATGPEGGVRLKLVSALSG